MLIVVLTIPATPHRTGPGVDGSAHLGLSMARHQRLVFGRDLVFSYGPLGHLLNPVPCTEEPFIAAAWRLGIYFGWIAALWRMLGVAPRNVGLSCAVFLGLVGIFDLLMTQDRIELLAVTLGLLPILGDRNLWRIGSLLGLVAAAMVLAKINLGVEAIAIAAGLCVGMLLERRRRAAITVISAFLSSLVVGLLGLAAIFNGGAMTVPAYLRGSWQVAQGYAAAVGQDGPSWQLAGGVVTALGLTFPAGISIVRRDSIGSVVAIFLAFLLFRHAFTRQESGHTATYQTRMAMPACFLLASPACSRRRRIVTGVLAAATVAAGAFVLLSPVGYPMAGRKDLTRRMKLVHAIEAVEGWGSWTVTWERVRRETEKRMAFSRLPPDVLEIVSHSTVDAWCWNVDEIFASGLRWQPSPVFQTYSAYTPFLDRLNADHLESAGADFLVVHWEDGDGFHPMLRDPLSWERALRSYDLVLRRRSFLLLRRRAIPRPIRFEPSPTATIAEGLPLAPPSDMAWRLSFEPEPTIRGRFRTFLLRSEPLFLDVNYRSGRHHRWKAVAANLSGGFPATYLPWDLNSLADLFQEGRTANPVRSISVFVRRPTAFRARIPYTFAAPRPIGS